MKGLNFKKLLLNHAEKIVCGIIALFTVIAIARTSWSTYDKNPNELQSKAEAARAAVLASEWPEEERQKFANTEDIREKVRDVLMPIDPSRWEWPIRMSWPLYRKQEPIEEPTWLAVEDLIATPGRVLIALRPEETETTSDSGDPLVENAAADESPKFDPRFAPRIGGGRSSTGMGEEGGLPYGSADSYLASNESMPPEEDYYSGEMTGMDSGMAVTEIEARGMHFVSVRGVFPVREQGQKLDDAFNGREGINGIDMLQFLDFTMERKQAVKGPDPWAGEWQPVDLSFTMNLLDEVADFDPEVVDYGITDAVFTMPLPKRVMGYWTDEATHPRVKNYQLSQQEIDKELLINQRIIEAYRKDAELRQKRERFVPQGFRRIQRNMREIRQDVMTSREGATVLQQLAQELSDPKNPNPQRSKLLVEEIKSRATAQGRLLLVRYMDFDVAPGNAYRYRVRLRLANPNFGRDVTEVVDPSVVQGEFRETPWSESSNAVVVQGDTEYFLAGLQKGTGVSDDAAIFDIYQWFADAGTTINSALKVHPGQFIGGEAKTEVLRPAKQSFEQEDVTFRSKDVLIDVKFPPRLNPNAHPDLNLPARSKGDVGVSAEALVVDRYGHLDVFDSESRAAQRAQEKMMVNQQRQPWEFLKQKKKVAEESGLDALLGESGSSEEAMMMEEQMMMEQMQRQRNPTRLRRRK